MINCSCRSRHDDIVKLTQARNAFKLISSKLKAVLEPPGPGGWKRGKGREKAKSLTLRCNTRFLDMYTTVLVKKILSLTLRCDGRTDAHTDGLTEAALFNTGSGSLTVVVKCRSGVVELIEHLYK